MHLVVGLGNPGRAYARHRHNVGFMVVDALARAAAAGFQSEHRGRFARTRVGDQPVALLEPLTYMNLSGEAVERAMVALAVPLGRVVVVHDELDLPFGTVRVKVGGGAGGHRGLRSIIERCGGGDFTRVRVGIGRPPEGATVVDWVLSDFSLDASAALEGVLHDATRALEVVIRDGPSAAMNIVNARGSS